MARGNGAQLMEMLLDDGELRRAFRSDPAAVAQRVGVELDDDMRAALASVDWDGVNAELRQRVSNWGASRCSGSGGYSCAGGCGD